MQSTSYIKERLLVADDDPFIRCSLSAALADIGFQVSLAVGGVSALLEIEREIPDILLSDLHMPGMSGFELLIVVRQRYPTIHTIAMSGAFSGNEVPSGVAADAYYNKGSSLGALLQIIAALPKDEHTHLHAEVAETHPWLRRNGLRRSSGPAFTGD